MISFIIPLFNHLEQSIEMLASLLNTMSDDWGYEIILIDDGSTDGTREWLRDINNPNIQVIFNEVNLGYAKSNNKAINIARGDVLCLLNNDLILLDGWLVPMLQTLCNSVINAGIVGNVQRRVVDNAIDHAGIAVSHLAEIHHICENSTDGEPFNRTFAVTGACCMLFKQDFLAIGGFDEQYINGGEDVDLCLKLRQLNKYCYVANTSHVMHHVSLSRDPYSHNNEINSRRLFFKWRPIIFQEVKSAWMHVLTLPSNESSQITSQFSLSRLCNSTPHVASLMLANSIWVRQQVYWNKLIDNIYPDNLKPVEKAEGFCWDNDHHFAFIYNQAWLTIAKGVAARNIAILGETAVPDPSCQSFFDDLVVIVEINGIQLRRWTSLLAGSFRLIINNPVFSESESSLISIVVDSPSFESIPYPVFKLIRFSHVSIDDQLVFDLNRRSRGRDFIDLC